MMNWLKSIKILALLVMLLSILTAQYLQRAKLKIVWPFEGLFGILDRQAAQRGFQIYKEVCSACHSLNRVSYHNLEQIGFPIEEIKHLSQQYFHTDINDLGERFQRPANPTDYFVAPYDNELAARAANNGAYPVDLSLIIKARVDGPNYLYSLLNSYQNPPEGFKVGEGLYYNTAFKGHQIAMPPPLSSDQINYIDGTKATIEQMARDVVIFLQWTAEPEMENRKSLGLKVVIWLMLLTVSSYLAKKKIWSNLEDSKEE